MTPVLASNKMKTEDRINTERTMDSIDSCVNSYRSNIITPEEFRAFNRLGEILSYEKNGRTPEHKHSFVFFFVEKALFENYTSKEEWEKDKLSITNPVTDIYGIIPINIYGDTKFVKNTLDEAITHEGIFVLDSKSHNIIHNGLILPVDTHDLYTNAFKVKNDIELIKKTDYPSGYPPEIGTKSKAALYFSIKHPEVSFMRFNGDSYIIKQGKVAYLHKENDFKNSDLSSFLP